MQSLLGAHHDVATFPETHFFDRLIGHGRRRTFRERDRGGLSALRHLFGRIKLPFGYTSLVQIAAAWRFLSDMPDSVSFPRESSRQIRKQVTAYLAFLDGLALSNRKDVWLEKTPDHLFYVDVIRRHVPDAFFIHIIRNGADVVASLFDVARKYPGEDWQDYVTIDSCILRWNLAVEESMNYVNNPHHYMVRYEDLVNVPHIAIEGVCKFIDIEFEPGMLKNFHDVAEKVALKSEPWKKANFSAISSRNSLLFGSIFDESEQKRILSKLRSVDDAAWLAHE